jgi:hypothetical protein
MYQIRNLMFLSVFFISLASKNAVLIARDIQGTIRSFDGKPLSGVTVYFDKTEYKSDKDGIKRSFFYALTNKNGQFFWHAKAQVIFVKKAGFQPRLLKIPADNQIIDITLDSDIRVTHDLAICPKTPLNSKKYIQIQIPLSRIAFFLPLDPSYAQESNNGNRIHIITFGEKSNRADLSMEVGPIYPLYPSLERFLSAQGVSIRLKKCGKEEGTEFKWINNNGKYSRGIFFLAGHIAYEEVSKSTAEYFDRIIDEGLCCK